VNTTKNDLEVNEDLDAAPCSMRRRYSQVQGKPSHTEKRVGKEGKCSIEDTAHGTDECCLPRCEAHTPSSPAKFSRRAERAESVKNLTIFNWKQRFLTLPSHVCLRAK